MLRFSHSYDFLFAKYLFLCVYMYTCVHMCAQLPGDARRGRHFLGVGVTGGYEPPGVSTGNWTRVACEIRVLTTEPCMWFRTDMFSWLTGTRLWLGCEKAPEARAFDRLVGLLPVSALRLVSLSYEETWVQTLPLHRPPPHLTWELPMAKPFPPANF